MTLYFHIGAPKTGTTSLQYFLDKNQKNLQERFKILYPKFVHGTNVDLTHPNHLYFFNSILNYDDLSAEKNVNECIQYCEEHQISSIILSLESLLANERAPLVVYNLAQKFNCPFKIVVYLRRQDYWIESAWKQWGHKDKSFKNFNEFSAIYTAIDSVYEANYPFNLNPNWHCLLERWLEFFKPDDFIVRPFERETIGEDIIDDFMQILGVYDISAMQKADPTKKINTGYKPEVMALLNCLKELTKNNHDNSLFQFLNETLPERFKKNSPFEPYGLLSPKERHEIVKNFEVSNREVTKIFWSAEKKNLFEEPMPDPDEKWVSHTSISLESTLPILIEIMMSLQKKIIRLEEKDKEFQDFLATKIIFKHQKLKHILNKIRTNDQITELSLTENGILCMSVGNDPQIFINRSRFQKRIKALLIKIIAPEETIMQIYYKSGSNIEYHENQSINIRLKNGNNHVQLMLPEGSSSNEIRIDPGTLPGLFVFEHIAFGY